MKKVYNLLFIINILFGMFLCINFFYLYNYSNFSIIATIIFGIIYIACSIIYNKKKNISVKIEDLIFVGLSLLLMCIVFIFSALAQLKFNDLYILIYFNIILLIPHTLIIIYNLTR